jgi:hypothetical protein
MTLITTLTLAHDTGGRVLYLERPTAGNRPVIGSLAIESWALPKPTPSAIRVTVESYEVARPGHPPAQPETARAEAMPTEMLKRGDRVTIVKNALAGAKYPPEWLQQYLGRTGKVLWTTTGGAVIELDNEATWFPYAELELSP